VKRARALGIPTAACIMSWDHLSSKALVHIAPDRSVVWNDVQKREAVGDARIDADERSSSPAPSATTSGSTSVPLDPAKSSAARIGLDPSKPFVLYVCSAMSR
jgi:hypothetical protein